MTLFRFCATLVAVISAFTSPVAASPLATSTTGGNACKIASARYIALPKVVAVPDSYTGNNPEPVTTAMKAWSDHFMRLHSNAHVSGKARAAMIAEMVAVAGENRLVWPKGWDRGEHRPSSVIYHTMESVFPYAVAYAQYKAGFTQQQQKLVETWLGGIVDRISRTKKIKRWKLDNKKYQFGALAAAYGYATGKKKYLSVASRIYKTAIKGQRADGSLPGDSGRGGNALHYTNLALANLIAIAEFASARGSNLYAYKSGKKSIHTAIAFLAAATQQPGLIAGYAKQQTGSSFAAYSPNNQDRRWASSAKAAWGYYYLRRFGDHPAGRQLLLASSFLRGGGKGVFQLVGGNAKCFLG